MANPKNNSKGVPELSEREAEALVYEAFRRGGAFLPQTPEEVNAAHGEINESRTELPPSLRDPVAILEASRARPAVTPRVAARDAADVGIVEAMACAARNGSDIPPGVLERMEADERDAKAGRGDGNAQP